MSHPSMWSSLGLLFVSGAHLNSETVGTVSGVKIDKSVPSVRSAVCYGRACRRYGCDGRVISSLLTETSDIARHM